MNERNVVASMPGAGRRHVVFRQVRHLPVQQYCLHEMTFMAANARHPESMTSHPRSDSVNRCVLTRGTRVPNFIPIGFETMEPCIGRPNEKKDKNNKKKRTTLVAIWDQYSIPKKTFKSAEKLSNLQRVYDDEAFSDNANDNLISRNHLCIFICYIYILIVCTKKLYLLQLVVI